MHLDFIAEGWKPHLDHVEEWLNTLSLPMIVKDKDGKEVKMVVPSALRCRRAYTLVFPKEALDIILNTIPMETSVSLVDNRPYTKRILKTPIAMLRKLLRLKKIPEPDKSKGKLLMPKEMESVRFVGIGLRDDDDITTKDGITHEGL